MPYIQLVEFDTTHQTDEVRRAFDAWLDASRGQRTLRMAVVATDHDRPNHFWELLEFASEDDAAQVAELPETKAAYQRWSSLLEGEPAFHNLDVVEQVGGRRGVRRLVSPPGEPRAAGESPPCSGEQSTPLRRDHDMWPLRAPRIDAFLTTRIRDRCSARCPNIPLIEIHLRQG